MWGWVLAVITWAQLQLIEPIVRWWEEAVLGNWEEWLLALVRQGFEETTRFLNGLGAWFLSLFNQHSYREQLRRSWQDNSWQQWWGEVARRPSTLNALVANLVAQQQQAGNHDLGAPSHMPTSCGERNSQPSLATSSIEAGPSGSTPSGVLSATPTHDGLEAGSSRAPGQVGISEGPTGLAGSANAWWPRTSTRLGGNPSGRVLPHGSSSLVARLERPVVFVQQSGMGILDELAKRRHGLIEDAKMAAQLAVSRAFEIARSTVRAVLFLPSREALAAQQQQQQGFTQRGAAPLDGADADAKAAGSDAIRWRHTDGTPATSSTSDSASSRGSHKAHLQRSKSAHVHIADISNQPGAGAGSASTNIARRGLQRSRSFGRLASSTSVYATEAPSDALSAIRAAGYPHELHTVTTADGYVLRLERIPRPGARDVVFFMHGVLDTSMAWVSGGVTGSQAFAAWEAGMDVWLGNSRGNSPRQHQDPARRGRRYWQYNINHMGMYDIGAQLDHIHNVKCAELGAGNVTLDLDHLGPLAGSFFGGAGGGAGAKAAGAANRLLPGRAVSTGAGRQEETAVLRRLMGGVRSAVRIRQSNSDGNLYRWGSAHSTASSSGNSRGPSTRTAPAPAAAAMPDNTTSPNAEAADEGDANGAASAVDAVATREVAAGCAHPVSRSRSPQHPGQHHALPALTAASLSAPSGSLSAASRSHTLSSHGPLSPMVSCDGSFGDGGGDGGNGSRGSSAEAQLQVPEDGVEEQPERKAFADSADSVHGIEEGGSAPEFAPARVPCPHASASPVPKPAPDAGSACRSSYPAAAATGRLSIPGATPASASSSHPSSSLLRTSAPQPALCRNAVTLTVASPTRGRVGGSRSLGPASDPDTFSDSTTPTSADDDGTPMFTTFTLEAKTRGDFGPRGAARAGAARAMPPATAAGDAAAASNSGSIGGGADSGSRHMGGLSSGVSAAASVMDAVGSVLGPAADAVSLAVASAAATAGAAIANAAASATQLLQPAAPQRAASAPVQSGVAGTATRSPSSSPFAAPSAQHSNVSGAIHNAVGAADVEDMATEPPLAFGQTIRDASPSKAGSEVPKLNGMYGTSPPCAYPAGPAPSHAQQLPHHAGHATVPSPFSAVSANADEAGPGTVTLEPSQSDTVASASAAQESTAAGAAATAPPSQDAGAAPTRRATLPVNPGVFSPAPVGSAGSSFRRACSTTHLPAVVTTGGSMGGVYGRPGPGAATAFTGFAPSAALLHPFPERSGSGLSAGSRSSGGDAGAGAGTSGEVAPGVLSSQLPQHHHHHYAASAANAAAAPAAPYKLRCVAHSLGGMSVLIHLVNRLREGRPHHVSRLLLLTPAGFHKHCPRASKPIMWALPLITRVMRAVLGSNFCFPLYIPTFLGRALTFKLLLSASRIPGLGELLKLWFKFMLDGDISQWDRAMQMPHYSAEDMPAISVDQVLHLIQLVASDSFQLYDYGSAAANTAHYGSPAPPDVSSEYWRLDLPVHLVAGSRDGVIPPPNIRRHLDAMRAQGVAVSYREMDFGHLDFTFGVKEELRMYLMKVLRM